MLHSGLKNYGLTPVHRKKGFAARTDHDALRLLKNLAKYPRRLSLWRHRLAELGLAPEYRPGRGQGVPDTLFQSTTRGGLPQCGWRRNTLPQPLFLLLCPHVATQSAAIYPVTVLKDTLYKNPAANDSQIDGVVLVTTCTQRAHCSTACSPPSSPLTSTALHCMAEFDENCWYG